MKIAIPDTFFPAIVPWSLLGRHTKLQTVIYEALERYADSHTISGTKLTAFRYGLWLAARHAGAKTVVVSNGFEDSPTFIRTHTFTVEFRMPKGTRIYTWFHRRRTATPGAPYLEE